MSKSFFLQQVQEIIQTEVEFKEAHGFETQESGLWSLNAVLCLHEQVFSQEASLLSLQEALQKEAQLVSAHECST